MNLAEDTEGGGRQEEGARSYGCDKGVLEAVPGSSDLSEGGQNLPREASKEKQGGQGQYCLELSRESESWV